MAKCFGDMEPTKDVATTTTSTTSPPAWVAAAGQQNYNQARGILDAGFVPYTGQMTAPLAPNQQQASTMVAGAPVNANLPGATTAVTNAGAAPGFNYDFSSVVDPNGPLGSMSNYMNPYLAGVLDPTLRQIGISGAQARQGIDANATSAGAYGDARHGVVEGQQRKDQALQEGDATSKAYSDAFVNALTNRQQDLSRFLTTQQSQQSADEQRLARMRQSGIDLSGLDTSSTGNVINLSQALGQTGGVEQNTQQAADTAKQNEFLRQQGWTDSQISFLTSILSGSPQPTTTTGTGNQVTSQPNNSGYQAIGALASALLL